MFDLRTFTLAKFSSVVAIICWRIVLGGEQEENLSAMNTDPWYSAYHYSHPPLVERLQALDDVEKKTQ